MQLSLKGTGLSGTLYVGDNFPPPPVIEIFIYQAAPQETEGAVELATEVLRYLWVYEKIENYTALYTKVEELPAGTKLPESVRPRRVIEELS